MFFLGNACDKPSFLLGTAARSEGLNPCIFEAKDGCESFDVKRKYKLGGFTSFIYAGMLTQHMRNQVKTFFVRRQ